MKRRIQHQHRNQWFLWPLSFLRASVYVPLSEVSLRAFWQSFHYRLRLLNPSDSWTLPFLVCDLSDHPSKFSSVSLTSQYLDLHLFVLVIVSSDFPFVSLEKKMNAYRITT